MEWAPFIPRAKGKSQPFHRVHDTTALPDTARSTSLFLKPVGRSFRLLRASSGRIAKEDWKWLEPFFRDLAHAGRDAMNALRSLPIIVTAKSASIAALTVLCVRASGCVRARAHCPPLESVASATADRKARSRRGKSWRTSVLAFVSDEFDARLTRINRLAFNGWHWQHKAGSNETSCRSRAVLFRSFGISHAGVARHRRPVTWHRPGGH